MQMDATTAENSMQLPQKIKHITAFWPSDSISRNISKESENTNLKEHMLPYVHYSVIYNTQDLEAA